VCPCEIALDEQLRQHHKSMARAKVRDGNGNGDGAQVRAGFEDGV